jgi:hypothetical protein
MDYPSFADALARLRSFLDGQGHPAAIGWLFPRDTLLVGGCWLLRPRPQDRVLEEVVAAYQAAAARRLGVRFAVLCATGGRLWCYVYGPADRTEAEHRLMPDGLKLSVPVSVPEARLVPDEREWERLRAGDQDEFKRWMFM